MLDVRFMLKVDDFTARLLGRTGIPRWRALRALWITFVLFDLLSARSPNYSKIHFAVYTGVALAHIPVIVAAWVSQRMADSRNQAVLNPMLFDRAASVLMWLCILIGAVGVRVCWREGLRSSSVSWAVYILANVLARLNTWPATPSLYDRLKAKLQSLGAVPRLIPVPAEK